MEKSNEEKKLKIEMGGYLVLIVVCAPSPHSADKGPRTKTSCTAVGVS